MYNFILQLAVMVSLGAMIYLIVRTLPRIDEKATNDSSSDYFERLVRKLPMEKADAILDTWLEKVLRKIKVLILKLDNFLSKHLQHLKPNGSVAKPNLFDGLTKLTINPEDARKIEKKEESELK